MVERIHLRVEACFVLFCCSRDIWRRGEISCFMSFSLVVDLVPMMHVVDSV